MKFPQLGTLKLRGRLTLYATLVSVVPLFALAWVQSYGAERRMRQQLQDTLNIEAAALKDLVETTLAEREADVRGWAEDHTLRTTLQAGNSAEVDLELASFLRRAPTFRGMAVFGLNGRLISASSAELRKAYEGRESDVLASPWFRAALDERVADEGLSQEDDPAFGARVLPMAVPVFAPSEGKQLGVLLAAYDWGQLVKVVEPTLARANARKQQTFFIEILRADNTPLFDSRGDGAAKNDSQWLSGRVQNDATVRDVGDGWHFVTWVDAAEAYRTLSNTTLLSFGLSALFALLAATSSFLLARNITRPMTALSAVVRRIIDQRDLTQPLPVRTTHDEVGELAAAFTRMLEHLRETTAGLQRGMLVLNDTVSELKEATRQQEKNIARQAAAIQETQVTTQEIKQTSLLAAEKADAVLSVASRAEEVGRSGEAAITGSLGGFEDLRTQVAQMAHRIAQLNERTQQIGGITQTVKDLADQSNMLALNAAIEAVRSGEHGKGFGVVAREIRSLADQSIQATERVRDILGDISQAILSTAKMTELGYTRMEEGLGQVRASGENLKELSTIVQDNSAAVRQIAAAVSQQNAGIAQIFGAVTDLSTMMNETVSSLQATTNATRALQEVAEQMQHVARSYRV
jgi:methyl-accepting chemotaxis protein